MAGGPITYQCSRRNNIEIQGIPQSVKSKEYKVIDVPNKVNVKVTKNDIEACHHLGESAKTIVMFINQNHLFETLKNKKCFCLLILPVLGSTRMQIFF